MIVQHMIDSEKTDAYPSMYKLVDDSSLNCSILALNESGWGLARTFNRCGWNRLAFLRGCIDLGHLYLGVRCSGDLVDLLRCRVSGVDE